MLLVRSGSRRVRGVTRIVSIAILLSALCPLPARPREWDRKSAEDSLTEARKLRSELNESQDASREKMLACARAFRQVYLNDPHYGGCDDAIFEEALVYQELGQKFGKLPDYKNSAKLFRLLLKGYPSSKYCPDALLHLGDLLAGPLEDNARAQEAYEQLRKQYGKSKAAASLSGKPEPEETPKESSAAPKTTAAVRESVGISMVENIRHWSPAITPV